jgi:immune inhibitor A
MNTNDQRRIVARYSDTCFVPPSPELRQRWAAELERARGRRSAVAGALGLERNPRRIGFDDGVIIPPSEFPFGTPVATIRRAALERAPLRGTVRVIVVLVQFSDKAMTSTASHFKDLFFSSGVLPHGSVKEYYTEVTNGLITLSGDVVGPYQLPQTLAWYANGNSGIGKGPGAVRAPQMAHDAAVAADSAVNFQPYDNDGNGFVDAFIVVHAGQGAEVTGGTGDIWSHKSVLPAVYATDNTKIYGYLTIPEDAKIGVCAHELGHLLFGFPDLYDTDYTSEGIGNWCLMSGGSWNGGGDVPAHASAWCKVNQGWASATNVTTNGSVTIPDVKLSHNVLRLSKDGTPGPEYFLVENRQRTGFDADLPGDGLLVWHIDDTQTSNTDENHYEVALLQADAQRDLELNHNRGDAGDPYPGSASNTSLTATSTPNTKSYASQDTCVSITNISTSAATMSATITVHCGKSVAKDIKDVHKDHKEIGKDILDNKGTGKDHKEVAKDIKDLQKDHKEIGKDITDNKGVRKELKEAGKDIKEAIKDIKEAAKEIKEGGKEAFERPPGGGGDFGAADDRVAVLEARVSALEQVVGASAQPFIGAELRPDLLGGPATAAPAADLGTQMAAGDPAAKRSYDAPPAVG